MLLAGCIVLVGVVIQATTYSLGQIIAGRTITGVGIGLYTGTVPMYVSETANAEHRGALVLFEGVSALSGLAIASWVNFGMFHAEGSVTWRFPIALQLSFLLFLLACTPFLPESPRWLVKKERLEEATSIMARLKGLTVDDSELAHEIAVIHGTVLRDAEYSRHNSASMFSMDKNRHFHRFLLAMVATMITQLTGINVIAFYSTTIFETTLGYSGGSARIFAACLQITLALGGLTAIFVVDRFGRRKLMLFSTACMVLAQAAVAGLSSDLKNASSARVAIFFYFFAMYTLPIGSFIIPFMYGAEVAPLAIRHKITAMGAATSWLFNFMVTEVTPIAFGSIKWKYNLVYASTSVVGCILIYLFFPETKGRSLEEIDQIFIQSNSIFNTVKKAKELPFGMDLLEELDEKPGSQAHVE